MTESTKGLIAIFAAFTLWGLSMLFYKALSHVPAEEVLIHRTVWGAVLFFVVLAVQGRAGAPLVALRETADLKVIAIAAALVGVNWYLFILSVQIGKALESSLGYFIYPLIAVLFGRLFFQEKMSGVQVLCVAVMATAVLVLSVGLGVAPWLALSLAVTFALYGVIKKRLSIGPVVSVTCESILLTPLALAAFAWLWSQDLTAFGRTPYDTIMLILCGPITAGPLVLFAYASRRIAMRTVGMVSYINPSMQFLIAAFIFSEPVTRWHAIAFPMIWGALVLYTFATWRQDRAARNRATLG